MAHVEDDAQKQHQLTEAQLKAIEKEVEATQPLAFPLMPIDVLLQQYSSSDENGNDGGEQQQQGFLQSATFLSKKYKSLRKIRGDGNCYYRAFLYAVCEHLLRCLFDNNPQNQSEFRRLKDIVDNALKWVCQYGYEEDMIGMFHEELVEVFDSIEKANTKEEGSPKDLDDALHQLHSSMNEDNVSDCFLLSIPSLYFLLGEDVPIFLSLSLSLFSVLFFLVCKQLHLVHARHDRSTDEIQSGAIPTLCHGGELHGCTILLRRRGGAHAEGVWDGPSVSIGGMYGS